MADPAYGVAPIKPEYLRKERQVLPAVDACKKQADSPASPPSKVAPQPKSKRQMKKASLQLVTPSIGNNSNCNVMAVPLDSVSVVIAGAARTAGSRLVQ